MNKRVKTGYTESSKAVTAHCEVEYTEEGTIDSLTESLLKDKARKETEELMDDMLQFSSLRTMRKQQ